MFGTNPHDLSPIPGIHTGEEEHRLLQLFLWPPHMYTAVAHVPTHIGVHVNTRTPTNKCYETCLAPLRPKQLFATLIFFSLT